MRDVPATIFKAKCLELMDRVAERHESFVITKRGKPVAKLVPVERRPQESIFDWMRGRVSIRGDIINSPLPPETWETLEEWDELNGGPDSRPRRIPKSRRRSRPGR
jgi:prevent-host-death family protein